jgi:hypothetical protein
VPRGIEMGLTLEWIGRYEELPWKGEGAPPADALAQLFYGLNLLYAESFYGSLERQMTYSQAHRFYRTYPQWRRMLRRYPFSTPSNPVPPPDQWPGKVLLPRMPPGSSLQIESIAMASPIDLILHLPAAAAIPGGIAGVFGFIRLIEKAWNAPKRIRLEGIELERRTAEELTSRDIAQKEREAFERDGFALSDGWARFPDDWNWPEGGGLPKREPPDTP